MHEEPSGDSYVRIEMALLQFRRLAAVVGEEDPVDVRELMFPAAYIGADIEAGIAVTAVFPVDQVDLFLVDQEVDIPCVTMDVALFDTVVLCELRKPVDAFADLLELREKIDEKRGLDREENAYIIGGEKSLKRVRAERQKLLSEETDD